MRIFVYDLPQWLVLGSQRRQEVPQQYSLGSVLYERIVSDSRVVENALEASLFFVPLDLEASRDAPPYEVCRRVSEARRIVEPLRERIALNQTKEWMHKNGIVVDADSLPKLFRGSPLAERETNGTDGDSVKALEALREARFRHRKLIDDYSNHVAPIPRVSISLRREWGNSCPSVYDWLERMQWITIEAPYQMKGSEAHLSLLSFRHTVPYPTGVRLSDADELDSLVEFQRRSPRPFLVAQVIGRHNRRSTTLRDALKDECSLRRTVCTQEWQEARKLARHNATLDGFVANRLVHAAPHLPLYATATFCMQPFGMTPSRNAVYQCLLAGGIPVLFEPFFLQALSPLFRENKTDWAVVLKALPSSKNVRGEVYDKLLAIPRDRILRMRDVIAAATPRLQYSRTKTVFDDAYDYALQCAFRTLNHTSKSLALR